MRIATGLVLAAAALLPATVQAVPQVELVTMGPGDGLFEAFGHTAFRVVGGSRHRDVVVNFGVFPQQDGLVVGFLRGLVRFEVGEASWPATRAAYVGRDRTVWLHRLQLTPDAARALDRALAEALRPGHRGYVYHHFFDNCATRPRDVLDQVTGGALAAATRSLPGAMTFRDRVRHGFATNLGVLVLAEILLARPTDRTPSRWEEMFLPSELLSSMQSVEGLVGRKQVVYERDKPLPQADPGRVRTALVALAAAAALLLVRLLARREQPPAGRRWTGALLTTWGLLAGGMGLVVLVVAVVSALPELRYNENLLVLPALDLWLVVPGVAGLAGRAWALRAVHGWLTFRAATVVAVFVLRAAGVLVQGSVTVPLATLACLLLLAVVSAQVVGPQLDRGPQ